MPEKRELGLHAVKSARAERKQSKYGKISGSAWLIDQGQVPTKEGSMSKVYVSELNTHFASVGMEIMGLTGQLAPGDPATPLHGRLQWMYTIAPMQRFGGGTNEIQRMIIAQRGLGLPRK